MGSKPWGRPSIVRRLAWMGLALLALVGVQQFFFLLPRLGDRLRAQRQAENRHVVEVAYGVLASFQARQAAGELTQAQAQAQALAVVKDLHYDGQNYFWINTLEPRIVFHPTRPDLYGKALDDVTDPTGKRLWLEFARIASTRGEGVVDYVFLKPGTNQEVPKTSFVKHFEPWGWVIGSGVYLDDVEAQVRDLRTVLAAGLAAVALLFVAGGTWLIGTLRTPLRNLQEAMHQVAELNLRHQVVVGRRDELGATAEDMQQLIDQLRTNVQAIALSAERTASGAMQLSATQGQQEAAAQEVASNAARMEAQVQALADGAEGIGRSAGAVEASVHSARSQMDRTEQAVHAAEAAGGRTTEAMDRIRTVTARIVAAVRLMRPWRPRWTTSRPRPRSSPPSPEG